ncbi:MAG TPA: hypothetical protein VKY74_21940 [Chloroflexia bacterium]|nr:hypothetical protein [Chloroflexia bacterium]
MLHFSYIPSVAGWRPAALESSLRVRTARLTDWSRLYTLLGDAGLSRTGFPACLPWTLVLERGKPQDDQGEVLGCIVIEPGPVALLRSLAVAPEGLVHGYDGLLLDLALKIAGQAGAVDAVLLVETAAQLPAQRLDSVSWDDLRAARPDSMLVRELGVFDSTALAVRLALPRSTRRAEAH